MSMGIPSVMRMMVIRIVGIASAGPIVMPSMRWDGVRCRNILRPGPTATADNDSTLFGRVGGTNLAASLLLLGLSRG